MFSWLKGCLNVCSIKSYFSNKPIIYYMNDSGIPELSKEVPVQSRVMLPYNVKNYVGGGYPFKSSEGRAAQTFTVVTETLKWVEKHAPYPLKRWASQKPLAVDPEAGKDINAYYWRKGVKFFYYGDFYTSESSDIVAHELGHGILDSYRPKTWNVQSLELWSFHEAFADITSIITTLQNEEVIDYILNKSSFQKDNVASRIGEEIGSLLFQKTEGKGGRNPYFLRNASIKYEYVDPTTLPTNGTYETISAECHSFGRVMLGALYEIAYRFYIQQIARGLQPKEAIVVSRNLLSKYLLEAITIVPIKTKFYKNFAQTMMWVAEKYNKKHANIIRKVFQDWKIVFKNDIKMLSDFQILDKIDTGDVETIILSKEIEIGTLAHNPLYELEIEIPLEKSRFKKTENIDRQEGINSAIKCLDYLHSNNLVGSDDKTPFEVVNNKLVRTYID